MEVSEESEIIAKREAAIINLLTFHYVEGFKFNFPVGLKPELSDVNGTPLITCKDITKLGEDYSRLHTPENVSDRKHQNLGALFYLLTAISLSANKRLLFSDDYTRPGGLTTEGKVLWKQLIHLGLASVFKGTKHYYLTLPPEATIRNLHEQAKSKAFQIYNSGDTNTAIRDIITQLRPPEL